MQPAPKRKSGAAPGESVEVMLPDRQLIALDMTIDSMPYVGVLNAGLTAFAHKDVFGWFLSVIIDYARTVGNGMPDGEDTLRMQNFADALVEGLAGDPLHPNALFLGRVTGDAHTEIMCYVNTPGLADRYLSQLIDSKAYPFEFDYLISPDAEWSEAAYWLQSAGNNAL